MAIDKEFWEGAAAKYGLSLEDLRILQFETFGILLMEGMGGLRSKVRDTGVFLMVGDRICYRSGAEKTV